MEKSDEKLDSMTVLMLHYCAGLQHCLDQEELERVKQLEEEGERSREDRATTDSGVLGWVDCRGSVGAEGCSNQGDALAATTDGNGWTGEAEDLPVLMKDVMQTQVGS